MPAERRPEAEVPIDEQLVSTLLREQHPDLATRPLRIVAAGWDNVLARLGDDLVVRLPRRALGAALVAHEQRWLPKLAPRLPLPIPAPVRRGVPGAGFPWAWSICPWFAGDNAAAVAPRNLDATADVLGRFLAALHRPAPPDAPANPYRGVALAAREHRVRGYLDTLGPDVDQGAVRRHWDAARDAPPYGGPPLWLHGDLHPGNMIVRDGALAAVVDFGDLTGGDPATDVAVAWMLFPAGPRARFRAALGGVNGTTLGGVDPTTLGRVDATTWRRAAGNALAHGLACLARSAGDPLIADMGRRTVDAVLSDADL